MKPKEKMGGTMFVGSDTYAITVVRVGPSERILWFTKDTSVRTDNNGHAGPQEYTHSFNGDSRLYKAQFTKNGWVVINSPSFIKLGFRAAYRDPCF